MSMAAVAERYTNLKRVGRELHGPCPFCGGDDRFMVFSDNQKCYCRGCEFRGDCFDLVAKKEGITTVEAFERLTGQQIPKRAPLGDAPPCWQEQAWQDEAKEKVATGIRSFVGVEGVSAGWRYLHGRGINPETMAAFEIGFTLRHWDGRDNPKRPAILIPWRLSNGLICSLKYRFVDDLAQTDKGRRFNQQRGSVPFLFGSNLCKGSDLLVCIEGEVNAMSVYQSKPETVDVLSFGSDSAGSHKDSEKGIRAAYQFAKERGYRRVLIWCDSEEKAQRAGTIFADLKPAAMQSPKGKDANDILKAHGEEFLWQLIDSKAPTEPSCLGVETTESETGIPVTEQARRLIERIYYVCDDPTIKKLLHELDSLLFWHENGKRAAEIADQIKAWCQAQTPLEGKALLEAVREVFRGRAA